jgi:putative transposase
MCAGFTTQRFNTLLADDRHEAFLRVVKETLLIMSLRILAYCLMPHHWHYVLWPAADRELSHFMHQLTTTHVRRWHTAEHSEGTGHVHQGPFKSFPVEHDDHLVTVCRYLADSCQ